MSHFIKLSKQYESGAKLDYYIHLARVDYIRVDNNEEVSVYFGHDVPLKFDLETAKPLLDIFVEPTLEMPLYWTPTK